MGERGHRFLEHTADVIIEAWGSTLEELFEESAAATCEVMTDPSAVEPKEERSVELEGFDLENLLLRWIEWLIYMFDAEFMLFSEYDVERIWREGDSWRLRALARGERYDQRRHESRTHVKAATYSLMKVWREDDTWRARLTLDI
ncbi:MAG: archease [Fervidicoccaceae archaeon]